MKDVEFKTDAESGSESYENLINLLDELLNEEGYYPN